MDRHRAGILAQAALLATRSLSYERRLSLFFVLALTAVLAPLLVLFGLRFGLIDIMAKRLIEDPANREIVPVGSGRYDEGFITDLASLPIVAFAVPNTRGIAASFAFIRNPATYAVVRGVPLIPSGPGDPLLPPGAPPPSRFESIALANGTARTLGVGTGDVVEAVVTRQREGAAEAVTVRLAVGAVLEPGAVPTDAALASVALLVATEDYRDGLAVMALGWPGEPAHWERSRVFARFRLYAASIYDVATVQRHLEAQGIEVRTRVAEIRSMQMLDRNLGWVFLLVASVGVVGFLASLAISLVAGVERKRRELAILRLIGFPASGIVLFPVVQALLSALFGTAAAVVVFSGIASVLNVSFAESLRSGETICRLLPAHIALVFAATMAAAVAAAGWAGLHAARIEPSEGLRDV
jgi:putative ABC transport system permease protein